MILPAIPERLPASSAVSGNRSCQMPYHWLRSALPRTWFWTTVCRTVKKACDRRCFVMTCSSTIPLSRVPRDSRATGVVSYRELPLCFCRRNPLLFETIKPIEVSLRRRLKPHDRVTSAGSNADLVRAPARHYACFCPTFCISTVESNHQRPLHSRLIYGMRPIEQWCCRIKTMKSAVFDWHSHSAQNWR